MASKWPLKRLGVKINDTKAKCKVCKMIFKLSNIGVWAFHSHTNSKLLDVLQNLMQIIHCCSQSKVKQNDIWAQTILILLLELIIYKHNSGFYFVH